MLMKERTYNSHNCHTRVRHLFVWLCAVFAISSLASRADDFSRKGKIDLLVPGAYWDGNGFDAIGGGLGINGNLHDHFALGLEGIIGSADVGSENGFFYSALFNVEYNLLKSRFTPFVTVSGGLIGLEAHSGDWLIGDTDRTTRGAFGGGVGLRWDITDHFLIKAAYRALEVTGGRPGGISHLITLGFGGSF